MTDALLPVTQADRDAASAYLLATKGYDVGAAIREGRSDHTVTIQAFARHRIETDRNIEAIAKRVFFAAHWDGWRGNQLRRDVWNADAEKSWDACVANGALAKIIEAAQQETKA